MQPVVSSMLTEAHWEDAHGQRARFDRAISIAGLGALAILTVPAMAVVTLLHLGAWRYLLGASAALVVASPLLVLTLRAAKRTSTKTDENLRHMATQLNQAVAFAAEEAVRRDAQVSRQEFESRLADALDMADGEPEVLDVIERSFTAVLPGEPVELLLADNSHAHLVRMASVGGELGSQGCSVDSPDACPAARRAQIQVFVDSRALNSCPKLSQRSADSLSALCVPVSIMGRTVGVIHSAAVRERNLTEEQVTQLATLAKLSGARIGMLRAMAETQLQASTDNLTGLLNRRSFEKRTAEVRRNHPAVALAMADLDHFKELNDTYGHETGDRALRLFSRVVSESIRGEDVLCRHGGEEFAIAFPSCAASDAGRLLDSLRARLDAAIAVSGLPKFTVSFGVTEIDRLEDLNSALGRADAALFSAKRQGRDRVVLDQATGTEGLVYQPEIPLPPPPPARTS